MRVDGFDWDDGNRQKCLKHGLSSAEIEEALRFPGHVIVPDERHSTTETRFIAIGRTGTGRFVFVAFTFRATAGLTLVRPISARFMHAREIRRYEQEIARLQQ
jgi:uncharacterized DUF497 family protein